MTQASKLAGVRRNRPELSLFLVPGLISLLLANCCAVLNSCPHRLIDSCSAVAEVKPKDIMESTTVESTLMEKTRELCQAILDEPSIRSIRSRIDTFMNDEQARGQYEQVVNKGQALQEKQQNAQPLTGEEIADFEGDRDALLNNPVARGFLDAQEELRNVQNSVSKFVNKTFELGRMPTEEDINEGCGHGCSCSH